MDNSINTNRCTHPIKNVRDKCLRATENKDHYKLSTMQNVTEVSWENSVMKILKSGCFSTGEDEFHCTGCHTQTLCTAQRHDSPNQTPHNLLSQSEYCIHRLHSRECTSYAQMCSPSTPLSSAGVESQKTVMSIKNIASKTATRPKTSLPTLGVWAQVAESGNQYDNPTLSELRTRIPTTDVPFSMSNPAYPLCTITDSRLRTFNNWPSTAPSEMRHTLASAGFLYIGESDRTCCFCCNIEIYNWGAPHDPFSEHARWRSECEWLIQEKGQAFINRVHNRQQALDIAPPKQKYNTTDKTSHPNFDCVNDRLTTVRTNYLGPIQTAQDIARAGFLLITETDHLCCFFCDGKITEWRTTRDFAAVHLREYPECQFIKYLYSPLVEAVVGNGLHTNDCVLKALRKHRNQYGLAPIDQYSLELLVRSIENSPLRLPATEPPQQAYDAPQQTSDAPQQTSDAPQQTSDAPQQTSDAPQHVTEAPQDTYNQTLMATPAARTLIEFDYSTAQILEAMHEISSEHIIDAHTLKATDIMTYILIKKEQKIPNQ